MFSCTTAQHIYCTNTVQTVQSTTELYLQYLHRSCCYMFSCKTAQHIYCTNTVQTVQYATELYLQYLHRSCCYMFSCTAGQKLSSWCLLKKTAGGVYTDRQSHPQTRSFKKIQKTVNTLPLFRSATQHTPSFSSGDCRAANVANSSFRMGWRNSGMWRYPTWRVGEQVSLNHSILML